MIRMNGQDETMLRGFLAVGLRALPGHFVEAILQNKNT